MKGDVRNGEASSTTDFPHCSFSTHLYLTVKPTANQECGHLQMRSEVLPRPFSSSSIRHSPSAIHCIWALYVPTVSQLQAHPRHHSWCWSWGWDSANRISQFPWQLVPIREGQPKEDGQEIGKKNTKWGTVGGLLSCVPITPVLEKVAAFCRY